MRKELCEGRNRIKELRRVLLESGEGVLVGRCPEATIRVSAFETAPSTWCSHHQPCRETRKRQKASSRRILNSKRTAAAFTAARVDMIGRR